MGIFGPFHSKPNADNQQRETKDERKAECPNCHKALSKIPGAKTKCPHCGEFMLVRTRPKDNARVVVTKAEADKIDEQWRIESGTQEAHLAEQKRFESRKEALRKKFGGKDPSDHDVQWGLLNEDLLNHAKSGQWGLYRNTRFQMAEILKKENKLKDALRTYLEVCYLDLNGPSNTGGRNDPELLKEFPPFDPSEENSFLAPGVIDRIQRIVKKLDAKKGDVRKKFLEHNTRIEKAMRLPVAPTDCWSKIEDEVWK